MGALKSDTGVGPVIGGDVMHVRCRTITESSPLRVRDEEEAYWQSEGGDFPKLQGEPLTEH